MSLRPNTDSDKKVQRRPLLFEKRMPLAGDAPTAAVVVSVTERI
jgi:hypothetical protein